MSFYVSFGEGKGLSCEYRENQCSFACMLLSSLLIFLSLSLLLPS